MHTLKKYNATKYVSFELLNVIQSNLLGNHRSCDVVNGSGKQE